MTTVYVRGNRDVLLQVLSQLPEAISGRGPDPLGVGKKVREAVAQGLLAEAKEPKPETKTRSPKKRGPVKRPRGLLTDGQDKKWRTIYATRRNWLVAKFGLSEEEASRTAAKIAWAQLKAEGARTRKAQREREAELRARAEATQVVLEGPPRQVPDAEEVPESWWRGVLTRAAEGLVKALVSAFDRFSR